MAGSRERPGDRDRPGAGWNGLIDAPEPVTDRPDKPVDLGNGLVCASIGGNGALLSLGMLHEIHGFVEMTGMPPFDEVDRGDPAAVRRYRAAMIDQRHAFLTVTPAAEEGEVRHRVDHAAPAGERLVRLRHRFDRTHAADGPGAVTVAVHGRLDRPPLAMITEVNPPRHTGASSALRVDGNALVVDSPALPASCRIAVLTSPLEEGPRWRMEPAGAELTIPWGAEHASLELSIDCALEVPADVYPAPARPRAPTNTAVAFHDLWIPDRLLPALIRMADAAHGYVRGCTALELRLGERAILTDHRLLPLSWTRDAYYQALLLLRRDADPVADHLRWLFVRCERPDGAWMRSHHGNGRRKDPVFQVDQQLYPLLELADFHEATGLLPDIGRPWADLVAEAWSVVESATDPDLGLVATDENPADDETRFPYLISSQILCWYVAQKLAAMAPTIGLDTGPFSRTAGNIRASVERYFPCAGPFGMQWAYAVDGRGGRELYQDANDLPTAFAPLWGFCSPADPTWQMTMRYALSPHNAGFVQGRLAGLGSRHTPGVWPLGDIQAWVARSLMGERALAEAALDRLIAVAMEDGMLPEAYDPETGRVSARHWFAWPGAALGALVLGTRGACRILALTRGHLRGTSAVGGVWRSGPGTELQGRVRLREHR